MSHQLLENPFVWAFRTSVVVSTVILAAALALLTSSLILPGLLISVGGLWVVFNYPVNALGIALAYIPFDFMVIALGKFLGFTHMTVISVLDKEVLLLLLAVILWRRNGFKPVAPDWFLLACFLLALARTLLGGTLSGLALDLEFIIPYTVGRVTVLSVKQVDIWARCAVWVAALLSVLGMFEIFVLGEGPRTMLYLAIDSETEGGQLTSPFHGIGSTGMREAATMVGPNGFAALCMIALVIWWVYCRNPVPGAMIAGGLICTVTRSGWLATAVAIPLLAVTMRQTKRLALYVTCVFALFLAAIPALNLSDYLHFSRTGQDESAQFHQETILSGLEYNIDHPFGSGNETVNATASRQNSGVIYFETTYSDVAAAYGIPTAFCFLGFLCAAVRMLWKNRTPLGYAATGILVGMCVVMAFTIPLNDRRLICWAWFPVGLAIRCAIDRTMPESQEQQTLPARLMT
jgi:hypothetical protein